MSSTAHQGSRYADLRRELAFWGVDVTDMSDEELEEGALAMARIIREAGVSCHEFARNISRLHAVMAADAHQEEDET